MNPVVTFEQIVAASYRIKSHVRQTPCQKSIRMSNQLNCEVYMKMENMFESLYLF